VSARIPMATIPKFDFLFEDLLPSVGTGHSAAHEPCACDFVADDTAGHVYNEEAFRYFLEIERKRSKLSNRPFLLLLVDLKKRSTTASADIERATSDKLFSALALCLRETDFLGWYRANTVVGAVLTQHADAVDAGVQEAVRTRVVETLSKKTSSHIASRLQVRVYQVPPVGQGAAE